MTKPWWLSRTIWVNLFGVIGLMVVGPFVDSKLWAEITGVALAVINLVLRLYTNSPLEGTPGEEV